MSKAFTIKHSTATKVLADHTCVHNIVLAIGEDDMQVSDGYHTMDELYDHRIELYIALCAVGAMSSCAWEGIEFPEVWRSKNHSDGEPAFGGTWFVLGIGTKAGEQMTYHLPITRWDETEFAKTLDRAPEYDGHSSADVLVRMKSLYGKE